MKGLSIAEAQRGEAATQSRSISRKDAKAPKVGDSIVRVYILPSKPDDLRLGERNFRLQLPSASRSFAQATQISNYSNTEKAETTFYEDIPPRTVRHRGKSFPTVFISVE